MAMNIRHIFAPWSRIAELERELSASDASGYAQYRRAEGLDKIRAKLTAERDEARKEATDTSRRLSEANSFIDKLHREIADLESRAMFRGPDGRLIKKVPA